MEHNNVGGLYKKSSRQEIPLATSTPIPPKQNEVISSSSLLPIKLSHIPKPMTSNIHPVNDGSNGKIPPPIAPKPKTIIDPITTTNKLINSNGSSTEQNNSKQSSGPSFSSNRSDQPSIIRTKKAEFKSEKDKLGSSCFIENGINGQQRSDTPPSRANSSLSQMAAEFEKSYREWRQARLQSMDVESRRTGDLVKIIANAATTETTASM
ncbi:hypothetical protein Mgra_00007241 [Meloidogyne graminicola]|uniref:Uncharacterized protein n=1 Tax=Meloidogyne graminicola TaxID=189291 RepID=A0A8S9ZJ57_9BILA|nr:hypothetical protein Mgra_00007241 [Meloidogyne graminicola]